MPQFTHAPPRLTPATPPVVRVPGDGASSWLLSRTTGARVLLVGTRHSEAASAHRVRAAIRALRPAAVVVELDERRRRALMASHRPTSPLAAALSAARAAGASPARAALAATLAGATAAAASLSGTQPAADLAAAVEEAAAVGSAIVCGDADASATLDALLAGLTAAPPRLDAGLKAAWLAAAGGEGDRSAATAATAALRAAAPAAAAALCDARDDRLAAALARVGASAGGRPVVGVVGLAHLDGVEARWAARERWGGGPRARERR